MVHQLAAILRKTPILEKRQMMLAKLTIDYLKRTSSVNSTAILEATSYGDLWVGDRVSYKHDGSPGKGYVAHFLQLLDSAQVFSDEDHKELEGRVFVGVLPDNGETFIDFLPHECERVVNSLSQITTKEYRKLHASHMVITVSEPLIISHRRTEPISALVEAINAKHRALHSDANAYVMGESKSDVRYVHTPIVLYHILGFDSAR